jgi:hypothetical protein
MHFDKVNPASEPFSQLACIKDVSIIDIKRSNGRMSLVALV